MKTVNTVTLKNHANQLLRQVHNGHPIIVTTHGKPTAALIPLDEHGLEELTFEYSPTFRRLVAEAEADVRAGRLITWGQFLEHERGTHAA